MNEQALRHKIKKELIIKIFIVLFKNKPPEKGYLTEFCEVKKPRMVDGVAMIITLHNQNGRGEITFLGKDISFMNSASVHIWKASLSKKSWLQHI